MEGLIGLLQLQLAITTMTNAIVF
uniref:Uncharacterized protein n=1 Tax=Anguilla anguilla TaxID=7936 RepID=A0A0E9PDA2_ANGAN